MLTLTLTVAEVAELRTLYESQLSQGRAFVRGAGGVEAELRACKLVIRLGERLHELAGEVVFVKAEEPGRGVGVQLAPMDAAAQDALRVFVEAFDGGTEEPAEDEETPAESTTQGLQDRIRNLSATEQQKLAATGSLSERIALERMFGQVVWETLLRNPRLTIPEVARIGRKGTLPRPLVESIAGNGAWLAAGEVQRALLSNPRASVAVVEKILRAMSRADLQLVQQQTAYPGHVRQAAKRLLAR